MGKHSFASVVPTFNSRRGLVASIGRLHGSPSTVRNVSNIKVGSQTVPRSLVLSFYSILRESPIFVHNICGKPLQERRQSPPSTSSRQCSCWQLEHLSFARWTISTPTVSFQYPGLSKRGYVSSPKPHSSQGRARASDDPVGKTVDKSTTLQRSVLHPPKQAPSVWQIFFTDWLQSQRMSGAEGKKLNVAQEAKEAGHVYNELSDDDREDLRHRALVLKEKYERELAVWKRTLTPADIERENAFRAAQRKSGKSRRKNINDPNAPKRPLTAYFLFLQTIRADPHMVKVIFGDAAEPTRQSVLAAAKWRSMSDAEKLPYLTQANNAKREYEALRKVYDDRLRSLNESVAISIVVNPDSSQNSPTTTPKNDDGILDATIHK